MVQVGTRAIVAQLAQVSRSINATKATHAELAAARYAAVGSRPAPPARGPAAAVGGGSSS